MFHSIVMSFSAGPLCLASHADEADRRLDDEFPSFKKFNRSLVYTCEKGDPAILEFTPNTSWPDIVYYNSFTQSNMGWKIHIIDTFSSFSKSTGTRNSVLSFFLLTLLSVYLRLFN